MTNMADRQTVDGFGGDWRMKLAERIVAWRESLRHRLFLEFGGWGE